jgi:hypothetical protein
MYKNRPHWFTKRSTGEPFDIAWYGTPFDLTHPEVKAYLANLAKMVSSWGVEYLKLDALFTGLAVDTVEVNDGYKDDHFGNNAPLHDPTKTNLDAYRDGLRLLRQAAAPGVFFAGCAAGQNMRCLGGSIGLVDSMRIGPDNAAKWSDYRKEIANNQRNSMVTGPVRGSRLYFLHGRTWWNDPDPCYVRTNIPLGEARLLASWMSLSGQFILNSDWLPNLPPERLDILKRTMASHSAVARPVDYFDAILPSIWLLTSGNPDPRVNEKAVDPALPPRRDVLGLFNWDDHARTITCTASKAGLNPGQLYYAFDFWDNSPLPSFRNEFRYDVPGRSCRVVAVRAVQRHPVVVSTSRHITQGIIDVHGERWNAMSRELTGVSHVVGGDAYELRIATRSNEQSWNLTSAFVSDEDRAAGVTIVARSAVAGEHGWIRVIITSERDRDVRWMARF